MEDPVELPDGDGSGGDGTAAVLYGIFTAFTESLSGLEQRLAAIEAGVTDLQATVAELRTLLEAQTGDRGQTLGQQAKEMGRRLASDLGLVRRPESGRDR
ncbi:MAG: hypothetical protein ACRD0S_08805 [Acidimicrobiales bacterium]